MGKYTYSDEEKKWNRVLAYQDQQLQQIKFPDTSAITQNISDSEDLLRSLGYGEQVEQAKLNHSIQLPPGVMVVPKWDDLCREASLAIDGEADLEALFTTDELQANRQYIQKLNQEYNSLHKLDAVDYSICALAGIVAGAVNILMVGIPKKGPDGLSAGPLSDYIRKSFEKKFPEEEMQKLANQSASKVPYDAQDNRHTTVHIEGLSAYYHRLLSFGHDPLLGFAVGVFDIMTGRMTTIDKKGRLVSQVMENYADRQETDIFAAIAKQFLHLKTDITTSMGLPAPLMGLFNLFQFGSFGEAEQTIAEIVQGMYYQGYDFIHFCSMSIPVLLVEVIVRLSYCAKKLKEGYSLKEAIPVSPPFGQHREDKPKLATMLFVAHSAATAINAGTICFTQNPLWINYSQWGAFAMYSYKQLKWILLEKPELRDKYVRNKLNEDLEATYEEIDRTFDEFSKDHIIVFTPEA